MAKQVVPAIAAARFLAGSSTGLRWRRSRRCMQGEVVWREKRSKGGERKASHLLKASCKNTKKPNSARLAGDISKAASKLARGFTTSFQF